MPRVLVSCGILLSACAAVQEDGIRPQPRGLVRIEPEKVEFRVPRELWGGDSNRIGLQFSWRQAFHRVILTVRVPDSVLRGKPLEQRVRYATAGAAWTGNGEIVVTGALAARVRSRGATLVVEIPPPQSQAGTAYTESYLVRTLN